MKNLFGRTRKGFVYSFVISAGIMVSVALSCQKKGNTLVPETPGTFYSGQHAAQTIVTSSAITQPQALTRINEHFKNEFSLIKVEQVQGINRQEFVQWLRNSKIAAAEQQFLAPLSAADNVTEFVLLHNVTVLESGKQATIALVAVPPALQNRYTQMIALVDYDQVISAPRKICMWKRCDSYSPCPCICWIGFVSGTDCPSDKCTNNTDCRGFSAQDCDGQLTGVTTLEVIAAW